MKTDTSILHLLTCGNVDDGKSTLIGRLLYDCGLLYEEQLLMLEKEKTADGAAMDFSCLLDGLLAEREQAITIDAAYRSFTIRGRRYFIADAPGHEQYTRNMATAASHAQVALVLVDASRWQDALKTQTKRHAYIADLLGIRDVIFAVNKMDCCNYSRETFSAIEKACLGLTQSLNFASTVCVPVSALHGENLTETSRHMPWYSGSALLDVLESIEPHTGKEQPFCFPVQWVARGSGIRGLSGTVISGAVKPGDTVIALPSDKKGTVKQIVTFDGALSAAKAEDAVCIELKEDLDIGRGEVLVHQPSSIEVSDQFSAKLLWMSEQEFIPGRHYFLRLGTAETGAFGMTLSSRFCPDTWAEQPAKTLRINDIGRVKIALERPLPLAQYKDNRDLGGFILIDKITGATLGAGMIEFALRRSHNIFWHNFELDRNALASQKGQKPCTLWFTGLSASGKSTIADEVAKELFKLNKHVFILDGDNLRHGLNKDLGFTEKDRVENIRRASEVSRLMTDAGLIVLSTFISPYREDRRAARQLFEHGEFFEIFVDTPLEVCMERDPKNLYKKALAGDLPNFTGISSRFEVPEKPELRLDGTRPLDELVKQVLDFWKENCV